MTIVMNSQYVLCAEFFKFTLVGLSDRAREDQRLLKLINGFFASGATYGSPWIHRDLRQAGAICSVQRVAKIMRRNNLKAQIGSKRRYMKGEKIWGIAENILDSDFNPDKSDTRWVSDITYLRTYEGFLYVATVFDLFSRKIVGLSMDKNIERHLVINALLMPVWAKQPTQKVLVHSDQSSQYGSAD